MRLIIWAILFFIPPFLTSCSATRIRLFDDATMPLQEFTIAGKAPEKILVIPIQGVISDTPSKGLFSQKPSMLQEVVSQLRLAASDPQIKAVVLKIDSPGGGTTASDIFYHELVRFKKQTGAKIVSIMMGIATSGGYYIALPSERIIAHPTTVTGSVGVVFLSPKFFGLMEKIGVGVEVSKSGENKDMGSPFRPSTKEEMEIFNTLIRKLADRFTGLVKTHRHLPAATMTNIATARVFSAQEALAFGLIDSIGYLDEALAAAKDVAGLPADATVVVYRRTEYANDNLYNVFTMQSESCPSAVNLDFSPTMESMAAGFYYLWTPGVSLSAH